MCRYGLLGEKLGHSYSPRIHALLAPYEYRLYERAADEVEDFVTNGDWDGLNVTIPYKKTVIPLCAELSDRARRIGSVNTLVRRPDGSIFGDNTDAYGFEKLVRHSGIDVVGKKALVFGTTENAFKLAWQRAVKRAKLPDLHFHDLRHEAASRLAEKLSNVLELSSVTGHKDLRMLKRYYHPRAEDLAKKLAGIAVAAAT